MNHRQEPEQMRVDVDKQRREFIKKAGAVAFTAPVVTSYLVSDLVGKAHAQEAYARFVRAGNNVITDRQTGLEWYVYQTMYITWFEAKAWADTLTADGGGWRMPSESELLAIRSNGSPLLDPAFDYQPGTPEVWCAGSCGAGRASIVSYDYINVYCEDKTIDGVAASIFCAGFAVRG